MEVGLYRTTNAGRWGASPSENLKYMKSIASSELTIFPPNWKSTFKYPIKRTPQVALPF
jgi:hypothetical protein